MASGDKTGPPRFCPHLRPTCSLPRLRCVLLQDSAVLTSRLERSAKTDAGEEDVTSFQLNCSSLHHLQQMFGHVLGERGYFVLVASCSPSHQQRLTPGLWGPSAHFCHIQKSCNSAEMCDDCPNFGPDSFWCRYRRLSDARHSSPLLGGLTLLPWGGLHESPYKSDATLPPN